MASETFYMTDNRDDSVDGLDQEFRNRAVILIAESIGSIPKNFSIEHQRLSVYAFYPPLNSQELRTLAIDNVTKTTVQQQIIERVYQQLEVIFEQLTTQWNSIVKATAKRFVTNTLEDALDNLRVKLLQKLEENEPFPRLVVQRFIVIDDRLKLV